MYELLKLELKRALTHNYRFWISLVMGLILALLASWQTMQESQSLVDLSLKYWTSKDLGYSSFSAFTYWMQIRPSTYFSGLFFSLWPLFSGIAYSWSFVDDTNSGIRELYTIKQGRIAYLQAKLITTALAGSLVIVIPIAINLIGCLNFAPANALLATDPLFHGVNSASLAGSFLFTNPWIYVLIWLIIIAIISALWSVLLSLLSFFAKKFIYVYVSTYLFLYVLLFTGDSINQLLFPVYSTNMLIESLLVWDYFHILQMFHSPYANYVLLLHVGVLLVAVLFCLLGIWRQKDYV